MESNSVSSAKISYIPMRVLDKQYYYTDVKISQPRIEDNEGMNDPSGENAFLMILDRSGSMCGGPWKALTEGAIQVATRIYEQNEFKEFSTMFFNHQVKMMPTTDLTDFSNKINQVKAMSTIVKSKIILKGL